MDTQTLYEIVDLRAAPRVSGVCLLASVPGGIRADYHSGRSEYFSLKGDDDILEFEENGRVTIHTDDGMVVFVPLTPDADILEFLDTNDFDRLYQYCKGLP